jgi:hypothetical protein
MQIRAILQGTIAWLGRNRSVHFLRNSLYNRIMEIIMEK